MMSLFGDPFASMERQFAQMDRLHNAMFRDMDRAMTRFSDPMGGFSVSLPSSGSAFVYSSHQVLDSSDPNGRYSRTTSTQIKPGGVVESRTAIADGRHGEEKVSVRRQLNDQYCEIERSRNVRSGEESSRRTLHNIEDDDIDRFDRKWHDAANGSFSNSSRALPQGRRASLPLALEARSGENTAPNRRRPLLLEAKATPPAPAVKSSRTKETNSRDQVAGAQIGSVRPRIIGSNTHDLTNPPTTRTSGRTLLRGDGVVNPNPTKGSARARVGTTRSRV